MTLMGLALMLSPATHARELTLLQPLSTVSPIPLGADSFLLEREFSCSPVDAITWKAEVDASSGWTASIEIENGDRAQRKTDIQCSSQGQLDNLNLVIMRHADVEPPYVEWVVVELALIDVTGIDRIYSERMVFQYIDGHLVPVPYSEYAQTQVEFTSEGAFIGRSVMFEAPKELQGLAPWDNPRVPDGAIVQQHLFDEAPASTETVQAALACASMEDPTTEEVAESGGCAASPSTAIPNGIHLALALLLLGVLGFCVRHKRLVAAASACLGILAVAPNSAHATTGAVYGYYSFWDSRGYTLRGAASDATGSRVRTCVPADTTCDPNDAGCCFKGVPRTNIRLNKYCSGQPTVVDSDLTDASGFFFLTDPNWSANCLYQLQLTFERAGYPAKMKQVWWGSTLTLFTTSSWFSVPTQYYYIPNISVNPAQDTTSTGGDAVSMWTIAHDAAEALEDEGETRHRKKFGSSYAYDEILLKYPDPDPDPEAPACNTSCFDSTISCRAGAAAVRSPGPAHELGHVYHNRVVGCASPTSTVPAFPRYRRGAGSYLTSEGNALGEATAQLVALLTWWDPATAGTVDIHADYGECVYDSFENVNYASACRNDYLALWEFIDTSTANAWSTGQDSVDVTIKDLFDGLVALQNAHTPTCTVDGDCATGERCLEPYPTENGTKRCHGRNRYKEERYELLTSSSCVEYDSESCPDGHVCYSDGNCYGGDPHGTNIRDWVYRLAIAMGGTDLSYKSTLWSSPCIQFYDSVFPFESGYIDD